MVYLFRFWKDNICLPVLHKTRRRGKSCTGFKITKLFYLTELKGQSDPVEMSGSHNTRSEWHLHMGDELLVGIIFLICTLVSFSSVMIKFLYSSRSCAHSSIWYYTPSVKICLTSVGDTWAIFFYKFHVISCIL